MKHKVEKVDGKWAVLDANGTVVKRDLASRKVAREEKKQLDGKPAKAAKAAPKAATPISPAKKPASNKEKKKEPAKEVGVANNEKVTGISQANYQGNLRRAKELKAKLADCLDRTGGFPSHRYVIKNWGYNMSLKAIIRHKRNLLRDLGREGEKVPTTVELERKKKGK